LLEELFELEFDDWLPAFAALAVITAPPANNIAANAALQTADIGMIGPPLNACLNYEPRSPIVPGGGVIFEWPLSPLPSASAALPKLRICRRQKAAEIL
jgi:hypothetical protein